MLSEKKIAWCENWLKKTFAKHPSIERNHLFGMAGKAGLYENDTYGTELSVALSRIGVNTKSVSNSNGEFLYHAFYIQQRTRRGAAIPPLHI